MTKSGESQAKFCALFSAKMELYPDSQEKFPASVEDLKIHSLEEPVGTSFSSALAISSVAIICGECREAQLSIRPAPS